MAKDKKESTTSVGVVAPLTDYADGITSYYLAPHFGRSYPVRRDGDIVSNLLDVDYLGDDPDDPDSPDDPNNPKKDSSKDPSEVPSAVRKSPTLMDIELVSNEVVYDAANNPTAKITFRIRNSSGEPVKAVNGLVQKK
jgi:hypothetical protein